MGSSNLNWPQGPTPIAKSRDTEIRKGTDINDKQQPTVCGLGFLGEGQYSRKGDHKAYTCWEGMIYRCLESENSVCGTWYNFQNFAEWYYDNYVEGLYLSKVGTEFSSDSCTFKKKNSASTGITYIFMSPSEESHSTDNRAEFCRQHGLDPSALTRLVKRKQMKHKGWTYIGESK